LAQWPMKGWYIPVEMFSFENVARVDADELDSLAPGEPDGHVDGKTLGFPKGFAWLASCLRD